ncbi:MAG: carboxypeptidase-like regulatory domain-containing protein [Isosphaeraceae bacterium]|nr:carboxypeptidase-like regulatory domain-containing protein [Isosphaeraceae bacterium]
MRWHFPSLMLVVMSTLTGCSGGPALIPVTGTVTLNGKPLEGATVTFMPDTSNGAQTPGMDTSGPSGNYKIMSNQRSGVAVGKYRVVVTKLAILTNPKAASLPDEIKNDPIQAAQALGLDTPTAAQKKKLTIDERVEGEFTAEVTPEHHEFDFDVKGRVAKKEGS